MLLDPDLLPYFGIDRRKNGVTLGRSTARYRDALVLARLILEQKAPELRTGTHHVFALLFDMNALWERYVGWLFRRAAHKPPNVTGCHPGIAAKYGPAAAASTPCQ